jgi:O-glycosyl hydrolase
LLLLLTLASAHAIEIKIDPGRRYQTIEGWGSSLISWDQENTAYDDPRWRAAFRELGVNILRIDLAKEALIDDSGDPTVAVVLEEDIQSNIARMNFAHPRIKVFGDMAVWLKANALEPEQVKIVGSLWTPPHWMKGPTGFEQSHVTAPTGKHPTPWLNEQSKGDSIGGRLLQSPQNLQQFGRYIAAWVKGFEQHYGVPLYAISIQNELSFENPFNSATYELGPNGEKGQWWQYADALKAVQLAFTRYAITTRVKGPHMAHLGNKPDYPWALWMQMNFIQAVKDHDDPELIDFLDFYNSNGYLGTSEDEVKLWAAYYHGADRVAADWPDWLDAPGVAGDGKPVWISEAGGESDQWLTENGKTGAIEIALKIHNTMVYANASSYLYWQMFNNADHAGEEALLGKQHVDDPIGSRKYTAYRHFSRYIRPGAVRIGAYFADNEASSGGAGRYDSLHSLNVSAYAHERDNSLTIVLINMLRTAESLEIDVSTDAIADIGTYDVYLTTFVRNFEAQQPAAVSDGRLPLMIPAQSVITLHGKR